MDSRLYAAHQLFKQIGYPFEWLKLSVKKNGQPFDRLQLSMQKKKLSSVWLARAICSKQIVSCLNGSSCLCKKNCFLLEQLRLSVEKNCQPFEQLGLFVRKKLATIQKLDPAICLKKNFAGFPFQNNFLTSYLCQMICYSPCILEWSRYELCLQTYHEYSQFFFCPYLIFSSSIQPFHFERLG